MKALLCQKWSEYERGWGNRPDGYSLHLSAKDLKEFVAEYWARMPDGVPSEYSAPDGTSYACEVDAVTYAEVAASKNGIRRSGKHPAGGKDGWLRPDEVTKKRKGRGS